MDPSTLRAGRGSALGARPISDAAHELCQNRYRCRAIIEPIVAAQGQGRQCEGLRRPWPCASPLPKPLACENSDTLAVGRPTCPDSGLSGLHKQTVSLSPFPPPHDISNNTVVVRKPRQRSRNLSIFPHTTRTRQIRGSGSDVSALEESLVVQACGWRPRTSVATNV